MTGTGATPALEISSSRQFSAWLAEQGISLAFTTYQTGKLFLLGLNTDASLSVFERTFNRCMGLWADGQTLYMSTLYQLWRFENALEAGQTHHGFDRLYVPRLAWTTGDLDIHDIAVDADGRVIFVNTLFGCLATTSAVSSFVPLWTPPFLSRLAAEDRCHLNGLALRDGRPVYVTAVARSDSADSWRDHRRDGGIVMRVPDGEVLADGLSMPHSPRVYRDRLWVLDSGNGHFGYIDERSGRHVPTTFCPGFLRGLAFHGDFAIVGTSLPRDERSFAGLPLDERLASKGSQARCGLYVIDLRSGDAVHWLRFDGLVRELYDVVVLPGARRPMALGFVSDEIRRMIAIGEPGTL